jgi:GGDEF domain-containing protein
VAQKIIDGFTTPFEIDGIINMLSTSIGISQYPADGKDGETLLKHADIAMYQAKNEKNTYKFYEICKGSKPNGP